ncbi:MAG: hypothetical protein GXO50_01355, partial [Chlorobi bacterium]|nr:hypothetical protein [Chlorobiota bacterium]
MKGKILIGLLIIGIIAAAGYYGLEYATKQQKKQIKKLEDKINFLKKETLPVRFKILKKDTANITFAIKFYDQDSTEFNADTITLQGQELSFDFAVVPVKKDYNIAFPTKIFTNKIPAKEGLSLFKYYDDHGFPQTMSINGADEDYVNLMTDLFEKIKEGKTENIEGIYGSMVQDIAKLNEFQVNHVYKIVIHTKGGIEVTEDI